MKKVPPLWIVIIIRICFVGHVMRVLPPAKTAAVKWTYISPIE